MSRRGFSPRFLRAVIAELERVDRAYDRLDRRIENVKRQSDKDRLSAERAQWVNYEKRLRQLLR